MKDIFRYSATVSQNSNQATQMAASLPSVIKHRLEIVAARDVRLNGSIVAFHGRASRSASRLKRLVTNWNLLHLVVRGAIQVKHNFPEVSLNYWLGFPKSIFSWFGFLSSGMGLFIGILYFVVESSIRLSMLLAFSVTVITALFLFLLFTLNFVITIIRFNLFLRYCIHVAEKQIEQSFESKPMQQM